MKTTALVLLSIGLLTTSVPADGYPFDPKTRVVNCENLRIFLSEAQIQQLSATGLLTLDESQLGLVHRFYPRATHVQTVLAATFNDNIEAFGPDDIHVFWVAANEVAVVIDPEILADEKLKNTALARKAEPAPSVFRISPEGQIYHDGKEVSYQEAAAEIERRSKPDPGTPSPVSICVAPPRHRGDEKSDTGGKPFPTARKIYNRLEKLGMKLNVVVHGAW